MPRCVVDNNDISSPIQPKPSSIIIILIILIIIFITLLLASLFYFMLKFYFCYCQHIITSVMIDISTLCLNVDVYN